ncbi:MAG: 23S rRNA (guanosine(2251)-2'-O)-methyltransferase RlmB [Stellaceae bacterium]
MAKPPLHRAKRRAASIPSANADHPRHDDGHGDRPLREDAWGGTWLYGRHAVTAALANPARRVRRVAGVKETATELAALAAGAAARFPGEVAILDRSRLEALLPPGAVHQGMALAAEPLAAPRLADLLATLPAPGEARQIVVLLDRVSDPHNVGAILRSAAAFGVLALIVPEHGAPPTTGALAKAASGALETVPLIRIANLAQALEQLKDAGFWCLGLAGDAPHDLAALDPAPRIALVLGAEGEGLRRLTRERCDLLVRIAACHPWYSLNVSNAAAVALYELAMRRG